jgi:hypothetical protein
MALFFFCALQGRNLVRRRRSAHPLVRHNFKCAAEARKYASLMMCLSTLLLCWDIATTSGKRRLAFFLIAPLKNIREDQRCQVGLSNPAMRNKKIRVCTRAKDSPKIWKANNCSPQKRNDRGQEREARINSPIDEVAGGGTSAGIATPNMVNRNSTICRGSGSIGLLCQNWDGEKCSDRRCFRSM